MDWVSAGIEILENFSGQDSAGCLPCEYYVAKTHAERVEVAMNDNWLSDVLEAQLAGAARVSVRHSAFEPRESHKGMISVLAGVGS